MNFFPIQAILIANVSNEEGGFWMQIMVLLLVAVLWGVYSVIKSNRSKYKDQQQNFDKKSGTNYIKSRWRFRLPHKPKGIVQEYIARTKEVQRNIPNLSKEPKPGFDGPDMVSQKNPRNKQITEKNKNLQIGMELLELDFLLRVVENTEGNSQNDITMRKLNFNEILRREKLSQVNSKALTVYAINQGNLYGKDIQCKAMGELAERTMRTNRHETLQPAIFPRRKKKMADVK